MFELRLSMKYLVGVFWSEEDEAYVAIVPDLPGCSAVGETLNRRSTRSAMPSKPGSRLAAAPAIRFRHRPLKPARPQPESVYLKSKRASAATAAIETAGVPPSRMVRRCSSSRSSLPRSLMSCLVAT